MKGKVEREVKAYRERQAKLEQMLEPVKTQAKKALVPTMGTINQALETVRSDGKAEVDHPDEGKASSDKQATDAVWVREMALVEVKASAFLV